MLFNNLSEGLWLSSNTRRKEEKALQSKRKETFNPFLAEEFENKT